MPFARAVADRIEAFKKTRKGFPSLPENLPTALQTFMLDWEESTDVWEFAGLAEFYEYLRGCNRTTIPEEWKPHFPKKTWSASCWSSPLKLNCSF